MTDTELATPLLDRAAFDAALEQEVARATRYGKPMTLVALEVDHFGTLKDVYGSQAARDVLDLVEGALVLACRESDTPASFGDGTLAMLLPECDRRYSLKAAARLKQLVGGAEGVGLTTISQGIATYPDHAHTPEGLWKAAGEALTRSRELGGDRVSRSTRGSLFRSNERRQTLGKPAVLPLAERRPAPEPVQEVAPAPKPKKERKLIDASARLITAQPPVTVVETTWSSKIETQLRQIATARFAS